MPFTMPNYEMPSQPELGNPLSAAVSGLLQGVNAAPTLKKNMAEAKYAPLTAQANAMSKIAYANLMGPQFLAKLMANPDFWANVPEEMKPGLRDMAIRAGSGQGTGNALLNPSGVSNALNNSNSNLQTGNQPSSENKYEYDEKGNNITGNPQDVLNRNQSNDLSSEGNWAKNVGEYKGKIAQGEEAGKLRAQDVKDLGDSYMDQQADLANLELMGKTLNNPELEKIKTFPVKGHYELSYYAATGTPEQKELIGNLRSTLKNSIASGSQQFKGAFRQGEQSLLTSGYPSEDDTLDVMKGKWESTETLKKMINERTKIMMNLEGKGVDKPTASEVADKMVSGDKIRESIHKNLYSKNNPTEQDIDFMMRKYGLSRNEIMQKLRKKGIM